MKSLRACFIIRLSLLNKYLYMLYCMFVLLFREEKKHQKLLISLLSTFCHPFSLSRYFFSVFRYLFSFFTQIKFHKWQFNRQICNVLCGLYFMKKAKICKIHEDKSPKGICHHKDEKSALSGFQHYLRKLPLIIEFVWKHILTLVLSMN